MRAGCNLLWGVSETPFANFHWRNPEFFMESPGIFSGVAGNFFEYRRESPRIFQ